MKLLLLASLTAALLFGSMAAGMPRLKPIAGLANLPQSGAQQIPKCGDGFPPKSGCLRMEYDRFKDSTMAAVTFTVIDNGTARRTMIALMSSFSGDNPAGKGRTFAMSVITVGTKFEPDRLGRQIYVLIDGNVRLTLTLVTTKIDNDYETGLRSETTLLMMTSEDLTKLVKAKSLEMRMGSDEFAFDESMRGNLARFWSTYVVLPT